MTSILSRILASCYPKEKVRSHLCWIRSTLPSRLQGKAEKEWQDRWLAGLESRQTKQSDGSTGEASIETFAAGEGSAHTAPRAQLKQQKTRKRESMAACIILVVAVLRRPLGTSITSPIRFADYSVRSPSCVGFIRPASQDQTVWAAPPAVHHVPASCDLVARFCCHQVRGITIAEITCGRRCRPWPGRRGRRCR